MEKRERMTFCRVEDAYVCSIPALTAEERSEAEYLAHHTKNTWQKNRPYEEILANTVQGKLAEAVFEACLEQETAVRLVPYDAFRKDGRRKHAPVDALVFQKDAEETLIKACQEKIVAEVERGSFGKISPGLRAELIARGVATVEIKSSALKGEDFQGVTGSMPRSGEELRTICANIHKRDFFLYPHYTRNSDSIGDFYSYAEQVRGMAEEAFPPGNERFLQALMRTEYDNACDIYTRLYFDYDAGHIYIPGYLNREDFFTCPVIGRMPGAKSGRAVYFMHSIAEHTPLKGIDTDERLWSYDREAACRRLFAGSSKSCPGCGASLRICNSTRKRQYFYHCYSCGRNFAMDFEKNR